MIREIVLDTETTGLDPLTGDRIVEIGCIELINHVPTGNYYHTYINPERKMSQEAIGVTNLTDSFLQQFSPFKAVVNDFLNFIADSRLIIHNAKFDIGFLNAELKRLNLALLPIDRAIDTIHLARKKFPGIQMNLDNLCRKFSISLERRNKHGALIDAELLAAVYLELIGGRQLSLGIIDNFKDEDRLNNLKSNNRPRRTFALTEEEKNAHNILVSKISNSLWLQ